MYRKEWNSHLMYTIDQNLKTIFTGCGQLRVRWECKGQRQSGLLSSLKLLGANTELRLYANNSLPISIL